MTVSQRRSSESLIVGAGSAAGRVVAADVAMRGVHVVLADDDLTAVDQLAEWIRSLGGVVRVESRQLDEETIRSYAASVSGVIDAREAEGVHPAGIRQLGQASASTLRRGAYYMRIGSWPGCDPLEASIDELFSVAERRGIGFIYAQTSPPLTASKLSVLSMIAGLASHHGAQNAIWLTLGTRAVRR